jgi:AcrR family transcriptional regulator
MTIPENLVDAAIRAARQQGRFIDDVPLAAIAEEAGISRSTLLRRLGGNRAELDIAVTAKAPDVSHRPELRDRAIQAAAHLISTKGLAALTLDAVARAADCSVPSLHLIFGGRDGLLTAVFDREGPASDLEALIARGPAGLETTVQDLYRVFAAKFHHQPYIMPALFADLFGRPDGPASRVVGGRIPHVLRRIELLLRREAETGPLRSLPPLLLLQLLVGPMLLHLLIREATSSGPLGEDITVERAIEQFAAAFARAMMAPSAKNPAPGPVPRL